MRSLQTTNFLEKLFWNSLQEQTSARFNKTTRAVTSNSFVQIWMNMNVHVWILKSRGKIFPKNASRNLNWRFSKQFLWSFDVRCILRFLLWNVTENVCISRTDNYAIILYILVSFSLLELKHIFVAYLLKLLEDVANRCLI